jgi:hypothetical protein
VEAVDFFRELSVTAGLYDKVKNCVGNKILFFAFFISEERVASGWHFNSRFFHGLFHCELFADIGAIANSLHFYGQ